MIFMSRQQDKFLLSIIKYKEAMAQKRSSSVLSLKKKIQHFSFFISDKIGNGYSSSVYHGRNDITNHPVAIKVIDMSKLKSINRELLSSQISILKAISHFPNLLNIYEIYTTKNNTYIISELCSTDLQNVIKKNHKFQEHEACQYMRQLQDAYRVIYEMGIIHRDLKPANILVTENGTLKVADFGFSIKIQDLVCPSPYNVGSPLYMAPESLKNSQYSYKTDIWSLGVIFYEMLTGETPWKSKSQKELEWKVNSESIQGKLQGKNFSTSVRQFLIRSLKQNKDERISPKDFINYKFDEMIKINSIPCSSFNSTSLKNLNRNKFIPQSKFNNKLKLSSTYSDKSNKNPQTDENIMQKIQENIIPQNQTANIINYYERNLKTKTTVYQEYNRQIISTKSTSKILISEIHFCRFLYKMLAKLTYNAFTNLHTQINSVHKTYVDIIKKKLMNVAYYEINNFNKLQTHNEYIKTSTFKSIEKIAHNYLRKYEQDLQEYWNEEKTHSIFDTASTLQLIRGIFTKLQMEIPNEQSFIEDLFKNSIVILDYLMTCKQLIELASSYDYEKFSKKSRIQDIVQGKITSIDYPLYLRIMSKARKMLNMENVQVTVVEGLVSHQVVLDC